MKNREKKKLLFIYNPNAGKGMLKPKLSDIIEVFSKAQYEVFVYPTQCVGDACQKTYNMSDDFSLIVCGGGDGTLNEVVSGMMKRNVKIPIGYIPAGTMNDFANSLGLEKDMVLAAKHVIEGNLFACDVGTCNDSFFIYVAAFGLFTDVSYQTEQTLKNVIGEAAYVLEGAKRLSNIPSYYMKITYDGKTIDGDFMIGLITNSKSIAGLRGITGKTVLFNDGEFEVMLIKKPKNPVELQEIITSLLIESFDTEYMYTFKAKSIVLESNEEIPWTLDGEFGGNHKSVKIDNKQQALELMIKANIDSKEN